MRVRLEDVCEKESSKLKQSDVIDQNGLYPVYGVSGYLGNINTYQQSNYYIAVVKDGAGIGRTMLLPPESSIIGTMQYLIPKDNVLPEYLYYVVKAKHLEKYFSGATIPHIYFKDYKNEQFDLVSFEEQRVIINRLKKIEIIIDNLSKNLLLLDELVRARFVEMFGTIRENSHNYPRVTLKEVCHKITDGKHGGCKQEDNSGYYYVGAREIYDGKIHYDTAPQITYDDFSKDYRRCNLEKGDMVIVNTGATIGKSAIASSHLTEKTLLQKSVALIKVNSDIIIAEFLRYCYMVNPSMYMVKSASAQPNLLLSKMNSTIVYLPPIGLQRQFASFVEEVDKSQFVLHQ